MGLFSSGLKELPESPIAVSIMQSRFDYHRIEKGYDLGGVNPDLNEEFEYLNTVRFKICLRDLVWNLSDQLSIRKT